MTDANRDGAIAVVGMAGRFPGASSVDALWKNLLEGVDAISRLGDDALRAAGVDDAMLADPRAVRARGSIADVDRFDAGFFRMSAREAEITDPQHRIFLEHAWEALERAGHDPSRFEGAIGVYAGSGPDGYLIHHLLPAREGGVGLAGLGVMLGNDRDHLATRVAYKLDLRGPSLTVQTACSTSLVAVHLACQALLDFHCDMALAGGVSVAFPLAPVYRFQEGHILSPDGHCRAFDAAARGTVPGDGAGVVVLRRLADAIASGDHIHAVILGGALNNDGAQKVGYTAPSIAGQAEVIALAHAVAGVPARTIGYVEAHGTGTQLGDPIEIAALTQAFRADTEDRGFCAVGSIKPNVGHLNTAAGVASLIKAVLAVEHGELPPSLHFDTPNPALELATSPFSINAARRSWPAASWPRRAGVSSFGFGGTNAHVVLEEPPPQASDAPERAWQVITVSAQSGAALDDATRALADHLDSVGDLDAAAFADVASTRATRRRAFGERRAVVCRDAAEARLALRAPDAWTTGSADPDTERGVVFLFPGQGVQKAGIGADLYRREPVFRAEIDRAADLFQAHAGFDLRGVLLGADDAAIARTEIAQPLVFAIEHALARLWMSWGVRPRALVGHSVGEYAALVVAGVISLRDAVVLVAERGRLMAGLPAGAMLAVAIGEQALAAELGASLDLAAINAPFASVASGPEEAIAALEARLAARSIVSKRLAVTRAFHSSMMDPILDAFATKARPVERRSPAIPVVSSLTGDWLGASDIADPDYFIAHLRRPVRFADAMARVLEGAPPILIEVGPGRALAGLAAACGAAPDAIVAGIGEGEGSEVPAALRDLARLWVLGAHVDWAALHAGERRLCAPLPTYPFERRRFWIEAPAQRERHLAEIEGDIRRELAIRPVDDHPGLRSLLDALSSAHVMTYLRSRGVALRAGTTHDRADIERALALLPRFRRLLDAMIRMLEDDGVVRTEGARVHVLRDGDADPAAIRRDLEERHPGFAGLYGFLDHCATSFPDALSGATPAISVLYPNGSTEIIDRMERATVPYRSEPIYLALLRHAALRLAAHGAPLRVLEIGGGQGTLTWPLAAALAEASKGRVSYTFTDLGRTFVDDARREASKRGLDAIMRFELLDVAEDPIAQGYDAQGFDLVVAYNVLHAVRRVPDALANIGKLLAPGGTLGLVEAVRFERWDLLTWGLADGFWYYDDELRKDSPLLPIDGWERAIRASGFESVEAYPREAEAREAVDHGLVLARRSAVAVAQIAPPPRPVDRSRHDRPHLPAAYLAPRTDLERRLAAICEELFGVSPVGVRDDFFALGADSLVMLRLSDRIRRDLGLDVPQHAAFRGTTIEALARAVAPEAPLTAPAESHVLVPIQPAGTRPPLFFVHPAAGVVFPYIGLARELGNDQPFFALQAQGLDGLAPPDLTIEAMARRYVDAIRAVAPRGPYRIGGFSFGCLVAFEMAQQIVAAGDEVALLALMDEPAPVEGFRPSPAAMARLLGVGIARSIWPHLHDYFYLRRASADARGEGVARMLPGGLEAFLARSTMANFVPRESRLLALRQPAMVPMFRLFTLHLEQALAYTPRAYAGRVTLFKATEIAGKRGRDPTQGWGLLAAGGVDVRPIPGEHLTLLRQPHVRTVAAELDACLTNAGRDKGRS